MAIFESPGISLGEIRKLEGLNQSSVKVVLSHLKKMGDIFNLYGKWYPTEDLVRRQGRRKPKAVRVEPSGRVAVLGISLSPMQAARIRDAIDGVLSAHEAPDKECRVRNGKETTRT